MADLIKNTISVIGAIISLLILLGTIFQARTERTNPAFDSPSLKILAIKLLDFTVNELRKVMLGYLVTFLLINFSMFILAFLETLAVHIFSDPVTSFLIKISVLFSDVVLLIAYTFYSVKKFPLTLTAGLFLLMSFFKLKFELEFSIRLMFKIYKDIEITIEADRHYLFNKCHEVLRSLEYQIDESLAAIDSYHYSFSSFFPNRLKVKLEQIEIADNTFRVKLEFDKRVSNFKRSKVTDRFINRLISKPKSADERTDDKKDSSAEVGD